MKTLVQELNNVKGTLEVREGKMRDLIRLYSIPISFKVFKGCLAILEVDKQYRKSVIDTFSPKTINEFTTLCESLGIIYKFTEYAKKEYLWDKK